MHRLLTLLLLLSGSAAMAEDGPQSEASAADQAAENPAEAIQNPPAEEGPKTLSGMSILGNEEAPKSLVIIPWKSSELGDEIGLEDTLDDRAQPVDKEVFLRELRYFEIRSGKEPADSKK